MFLFSYNFIDDVYISIGPCDTSGGYYGGGGGGVSVHNVGGGGGGSGYIGGCIDNSFTIPGLSGAATTVTRTPAGGADDVSYVPGSNVGTGGYGSTSGSTVPASGGGGRILITYKRFEADDTEFQIYGIYGRL